MHEGHLSDMLAERVIDLRPRNEMEIEVMIAMIHIVLMETGFRTFK